MESSESEGVFARLSEIMTFYDILTFHLFEMTKYC